jgi:hypothetical protein
MPPRRYLISQNDVVPDVGGSKCGAAHSDVGS